MQWYRKILIPTDGSKYAQNAVTRGLYIAKRLNADVTFLTVIDVKATVSLQQGLGVPDEYAYQQKAAEAAVEAGGGGRGGGSQGDGREGDLYSEKGLTSLRYHRGVEEA